MHAELLESGERVSRKWVGRAPHGFGGPRRPLTPKTEGFDDAPNRTWLTDTTYLKTEDGPAFLVAVLDLFGRRVVGWAIESKLSTELT